MIAVVAFTTLFVSSTPLHVALLPLEVEGLAANEIRRIDGVVRGRAITHADFDVLPEETTNALVDSSQTLGLNCHLPDIACDVELGKLAAVDLAVGGSAHRISEGVSVRLDLVDVKARVVVRSVRGLVPVDPDTQVAQMQSLLHGLFAEAAMGSLTLDVTPANATVLVDGQKLERAAGATTLALDGLLPGAHIVDVTAPGFVAEHKEVVVPAGATTTTSHLRAVPKPPPPPPPSLVDVAGPWVVVGTGVVVALAGGAAMLVGAQPLFAYGKDSDALQKLDVNDAGFAAAAQQKQKPITADVDAWNSGGLVAFDVGTVAIGVGVAGVVGGLLWRASE